MANSRNLKKGPGPGRPKGSPNKFTTLKSAFFDAFEELGGTQGLVEWARKPKNRGNFYIMIAKMLPREKVVDADPNSKHGLGEKLLKAQERARILRLQEREKNDPCPKCKGKGSFPRKKE